MVQLCVKCGIRPAAKVYLKQGVRGCEECVAEGTASLLAFLNTYPVVAAIAAATKG